MQKKNKYNKISPKKRKKILFLVKISSSKNEPNPIPVFAILPLFWYSVFSLIFDPPFFAGIAPILDITSVFALNPFFIESANSNGLDHTSFAHLIEIYWNWNSDIKIKINVLHNLKTNFRQQIICLFCHSLFSLYKPGCFCVFCTRDCMITRARGCRLYVLCNSPAL